MSNHLFPKMNYSRRKICILTKGLLGYIWQRIGKILRLSTEKSVLREKNIMVILLKREICLFGVCLIVLLIELALPFASPDNLQRSWITYVENWKRGEILRNMAAAGWMVNKERGDLVQHCDDFYPAACPLFMLSPRPDCQISVFLRPPPCQPVTVQQGKSGHKCKRCNNIFKYFAAEEAHV